MSQADILAPPGTLDIHRTALVEVVELRTHAMSSLAPELQLVRKRDLIGVIVDLEGFFLDRFMLIEE